MFLLVPELNAGGVFLLYNYAKVVNNKKYWYVYVRNVFVGVFTLIKCVLVALYFSFSMCIIIIIIWLFRLS